MFFFFFNLSDHRREFIHSKGKGSGPHAFPRRPPENVIDAYKQVRPAKSKKKEKENEIGQYEKFQKGEGAVRRSTSVDFVNFC